VTTGTQVQAAACLGCGVTWLFPDDLPESEDPRNQFPVESGPWGLPCPDCGGVIWVTDPMARTELEERP
jgi:hypothetical protein